MDCSQEQLPAEPPNREHTWERSELTDRPVPMVPQNEFNPPNEDITGNWLNEQTDHLHEHELGETPQSATQLEAAELHGPEESRKLSSPIFYKVSLL